MLHKQNLNVLMDSKCKLCLCQYTAENMTNMLPDIIHNILLTYYQKATTVAPLQNVISINFKCD